jgi:hypothetical protein
MIIIIIMNVTIPWAINEKKEAKKKLMYKYRSIEIQRMWNVKCFFVPIIIWATGIVTKGLKNIWTQYHENVQCILYNTRA